jgi:CheY-like chemotaxis protein
MLVVQSDYFTATKVETWLRQSGVEVLGPAPNTDLALKLIGRANTLHAAILDVDLRCGDWVYPVADQLNRLDVPFLFMTEEGRIAVKPAYQARPSLWKPILEHELRRALGELLKDHPRAA